MNALNILYVAGTFPKLSETFVLNEVRLMKSRGHNVRVLSVRAGEFEVPDISVIHLPRLPLSFGIRRSQWDVPESRWTRRIWAVLGAAYARDKLDFSPDVIHAHFMNLPALLAGNLSRLYKVPYTFMAHATDYQIKMNPALFRARVQDADGIAVISEVARAHFDRQIDSDPELEKRLVTIRAAFLKQVPPAPEGRVEQRIVVIARLVPMKGIDTLLHALSALQGSFSRVHLHVVGDGPEMTNLQKLSRRLEIENRVHFHGATTNDSAQRVLATASVAVLPARRASDGTQDGIPVFLMEAGALGVPVISTPVGGISELILNEHSGLLVTPDDVQSLAGAIHRVLSSTPLQNSLSRGMTKVIEEEFATERQAERLETLWRESLLRRRGE